MNRAWLQLGGAVVCEVCGTTCLKLSEAFTVLPYVLAFALFYVASYTLFAFALVKLPLGLAYGLWGGIGTLLTAVIGIAVFGDAFTAAIGAGMVLVVAGVALMGMGDKESQVEDSLQA